MLTAFHAGSRGSNPLGDATKTNKAQQNIAGLFSFFWASRRSRSAGAIPMLSRHKTTQRIWVITFIMRVYNFGVHVSFRF